MRKLLPTLALLSMICCQEKPQNEKKVTETETQIKDVLSS